VSLIVFLHAEDGLWPKSSALVKWAAIDIVTTAIRNYTIPRDINLTRRSVQSQAKNLVFPLDEYLSFFVVNFTFLCDSSRDT
jgi:hypothetical protein